MTTLANMFRDALRASPLAYGWLGRRGEHADLDRRVLRRGDDLVIDGYPRSGNTFALAAFRHAQPRPLNIGNHCHAAAQIGLARRFGIPAMVVLRDPRAAALSYCVYRGGALSPQRALELYIAFYAPTLSMMQAWTPALFSEVTGNFSASISRLNQQFGTDFALYHNTPDSDAAVRATIEAKRQKRLAKTGDIAASAARQTTPSAEKEALKPRYEAGFETPAARALLSRAEDVYTSLLRHPTLANGAA